MFQHLLLIAISFYSASAFLTDDLLRGGDGGMDMMMNYTAACMGKPDGAIVLGGYVGPPPHKKKGLRMLDSEDDEVEEEDDDDEADDDMLRMKKKKKKKMDVYSLFKELMPMKYCKALFVCMGEMVAKVYVVKLPKKMKCMKKKMSGRSMEDEEDDDEEIEDDDDEKEMEDELRISKKRKEEIGMNYVKKHVKKYKMKMKKMMEEMKKNPKPMMLKLMIPGGDVTGKCVTIDYKSNPMTATVGPCPPPPPPPPPCPMKGKKKGKKGKKGV